jgi:hypothetical protein
VDVSSGGAQSLQVPGATIQVEFGEGRFELPRRLLLDHIARDACAVSAYYGRFPVPNYRILVIPIKGRRGILAGTTWGFGGAHSRILIGEQTTTGDLEDDWIVTHEMIHTAFPSVSAEHHWIEEGIATYVEPLCRSWIGDYPPLKVWSDLVCGLPKGLPAVGDKGLDHTHTWGRTYWGGAMFCLLADVEIRRQTHGTRGLVDALRAILRASSGIESEWPIERALQVGDDAVGVPILEQLYARTASTPMSPDYKSLWMNLGVEMSGSKVTLRNDSAEANLRRAISEEPADALRGCLKPIRSPN